MEEKKPITGKTLSILSFVFIWVILLGSIISNIAIFAENMLVVFGAILISAFIFFILFVFMMLSCVFVFGVYIIENSGFWPLSATAEIFNSIIINAEIKPSQIDALFTNEIIILILLGIIFILSIIALAINSNFKKKNPELRARSPKVFGTLSLLFSIFGILGNIGLVFIVSSLL